MTSCTVRYRSGERWAGERHHWEDVADACIETCLEGGCVDADSRAMPPS